MKLRVLRNFRWPDRVRRRGMTLIEALVSLLITSVIVVAVLSLYTIGQKYFMNTNAQADILEDSRYPIPWIARDVKIAVQVAPSWGGYTTSASTLVLKVPSVDADGLIIDVAVHFDYIVYRRSARFIERIVDANPPSARVDDSRFLADNITGLAFSFFDSSDAPLTSNFILAASVKAGIATNLKGFQRLFDESLNSKFKLRNK